QYQFDDVGRQQAEPENAPHVCLCNLLSRGDLADRRVLAAFQHLPPPKCARDRLDHCIVDMTRDGRQVDRTTFRAEYESSPAPLLDDYRHSHRNGLPVFADLRFHQAAFLVFGLIAPRSTMRSVRPSVRSRMSAPSGLTSTRSTSN